MGSRGGYRSEGFYIELIDSQHISVDRLATKPTK